MMRSISARILLVLILVSFIILPSEVQADDMKNVLLLHSYNEGYPWTDEIHRGIRDTIDELDSVVLSIDYLEANTFGSVADFALLADT